MSDFLIGIRDALNILIFFIVELLAWCSEGTNNRIRVAEPREEGIYADFQGAHPVNESSNNYAFPKLSLPIR